MGEAVLTNGPCSDCAWGQGDCRDVQISELDNGGLLGLRVWCLNCGAYFDIYLDGITLIDFAPYRQAAA